MVTPRGGNNLFHRVVGDGNGNFYLVYQSWRGRRSDIYLRAYSEGKWSGEVNLSDSERYVRANDWSAVATVDREGTVWVAWDGYGTGNYNIFLRSVRHGKPGRLIQVTDSGRFHARPSLAVDRENRLWIAWEEGPENWGKDSGMLLKGGSGLYERRTIRVAVYDNGNWLTTLRQPDDHLPFEMQTHFDMPRLAVDSKGHVWLFAHPRTSIRNAYTDGAGGVGKWELVASYYLRDRWTEPKVIPNSSIGRAESEFQVSPDSAGDVHVVMVSEQRVWGLSRGGWISPGAPNYEVMYTRLNSDAPVVSELARRVPEPPAGRPLEPSEKQLIAELRNYVISSEGKTYRIYRGDLHRHTDTSKDGPGDGPLWDAYDTLWTPPDSIIWP